jgi:uncharacterized protein YndB with AHSA1/START domain
MNEFHGTATTSIDARPEAVFDLITDVDGFPDWNIAIDSVVERPDVLTPDLTWTVRMKPPKMPRWFSVSRVDEIDRARGVFAYETRNADGNPSFLNWRWTIVGNDDACEVTVTWDAYLKTADRRLLAGPIRKRQLAREVPNSLSALARTLEGGPK